MNQIALELVVKVALLHKEVQMQSMSQLSIKRHIYVLREVPELWVLLDHFKHPLNQVTVL